MSKTTALKDQVGRILGYREQNSDGKIYLLNKVRRRLGYYDPRTNETWQLYPIRKQISKEGDLLSTLLEVENDR